MLLRCWQLGALCGNKKRSRHMSALARGIKGAAIADFMNLLQPISVYPQLASNSPLVRLPFSGSGLDLSHQKSFTKLAHTQHSAQEELSLGYPVPRHPVPRF